LAFSLSLRCVRYYPVVSYSFILAAGTVDGEADSNEKVEAAIDCDEPGLSKEGSSTAEICRSSIGQRSIL